MALSGEKSKAWTAHDLGIAEGLLYKWIDRYGPAELGNVAMRMSYIFSNGKPR